MPKNEIHEDDIGTIFRVTIKDGTAIVDISSATTKDILFRKSDGSVITRAGSFVTDGTDGKLQYITISGDLNPFGDWSIQAHVILPEGEWKTDIKPFRVHPNL